MNTYSEINEGNPRNASIMCISQKRGLEEDTREPKIESLISRSNNFV